MTFQSVNEFEDDLHLQVQSALFIKGKCVERAALPFTPSSLRLEDSVCSVSIYIKRLVQPPTPLHASVNYLHFLPFESLNHDPLLIPPSNPRRRPLQVHVLNPPPPLSRFTHQITKVLSCDLALTLDLMSLLPLFA